MRHFLSVRTCRQVERTGLLQGGAVFQHPHTALQQCGGVVRIPDSPGINIFLLKRRARIGRRQVNGLDIGEF